MEKLMSIIVLLSLFLVPVYAQNGETPNPVPIVEPSPVKQQIAIRGVVKDINIGKDGANLLVEGNVEKDTLYDKASVHVDIHTIILKDNLKRLYSVSDIKVGDTVEVIFTNDPVAMIYPIRATAVSVRMISNNP